MKLAGNKAIVTGASRGLGHAVAVALWQEGADLLLVARSECPLRKLQDRLAATAAAQQQVRFLAADLRGPDAPRAILAEARRMWPRLDILVNNAAIGGPIGPLADNDWDAWHDTIRVNLLAPAELCKRSIMWMRETGGGRIVNLSGGGAASPRPNFSAYAAAKCALVRLTETIAAETAGLGIRVNAVAPGVMDTEMRRDALASGLERAGAASDPQTAAELILYLASEESAGITGKLISAVWDPWRTLHEHVADLAGTDVYSLRRILPEERGKVWSGE
jgi:3-oxoacyl-[acyl-carrier protein] reductase